MAVAGSRALSLAQASYQATLLRVLEVALASNPRIMSMIRTPRVYLGTEEEEIRRTLAGIFEDLPDEAVAYLVGLVRSGVAHAPSKTSLNDQFQSLVGRDYSQGSEFRCQICGYHFRPDDLGAYRLDIVMDAGLRLASETLVGRLRDPWKRSTRENQTATIDHIIPEGALGSPDMNNLRILCGFCNRVRKITVRYEELLVNRAASALLAVAGRGPWAYEAATYFVVSWRGQCGASDCTSDSQSAELTAIPLNGDRRWTGLLPWQLDCRCYDHAQIP